MKSSKLFPAFIFILLSIISIISVSSSNAAGNSDEIGLYRVSVEARDVLQTLNVTVRHGKIDGDFAVEMTAEQAEYVSSLGYETIPIFAMLSDEDRAFRDEPGFRDFHTYTQLINGMIQCAAAYPSIALLVDLGNSVQGRELYAVKLTDNPSVEEDEPEIAFWGNIHGNEYMAGEMPYMYMLYLCQNYGILPEVTEMVNSSEIWCIPMINPDGRVNGQRNNANNVDLNRDFGYNWDGQGSSSSPFSQIESKAVRDLGEMNNLSISISYHCSGDEFYYPWGYFPANAPDYLVLTRVGERYADAANYDMMSSYQSYETHGEILDWAYGCQGGLSYTAEISSSSSQIQTTFDRNRPGMTMYVQFAQEGLQGTVTDSLTGEPLYAMVRIIGNWVPGYTDPQFGDFHRIVTPGTYNLKVWANGYQPKIVNNVQVSLGTPGEFTAELSPGGGEYAFKLVSVNQDDPSNTHLNVTHAPWALGAPDELPSSMGTNGFIVLDMGEGHEICNGAGSDFTVTEVIAPRDQNPESYRVYGSANNAYSQTTLIGNGIGTTSFDLNGCGLDTVRFLKIVDQSGSTPSQPLSGMDLDGVTILNSVFTAGDGNIASETVIPEGFSMSVHPNPFNSSAVFSFDLPASCFVSLKIYDIAGRQVTTLSQGVLSAGKQFLLWNADGCSSGIYFAKIESGGFSGTEKLILMK